MSIQVERSGIEYSAVQYKKDSDWLDQLAALGVVFKYSCNLRDGDVNIDNLWFIALDDYIIVRDGNIFDIRSPLAFMKMYGEFELEEVETITFKIEDLKNYILSLSSEKDEYWVSERVFVADEFSAFFSYLGCAGCKTMSRFASTICGGE